MNLIWGFLLFLLGLIIGCLIVYFIFRPPKIVPDPKGKKKVRYPFDVAAVSQAYSLISSTLQVRRKRQIYRQKHLEERDRVLQFLAENWKTYQARFTSSKSRREDPKLIATYVYFYVQNHYKEEKVHFIPRLYDQAVHLLRP